MFWYASYIRTIKNYITYAELILYKSAGARSDVGGPPAYGRPYDIFSHLRIFKKNVRLYVELS